MAEAVRLEISVDDKGSPVIKTVSNNLEKLAQQSAKTAAEHTKLNRAADEAVGIFADLGIQVGAAVQRVAGAIGPIGLLTGAIGTGLTVAATASIAALRDLAFQTRDLAFVSGGTPEQVSGLIDVLDDFGVEAQTVERAMVFLSRAIQEGSPALDQLGIRIRTSSGHLKSAHDLFYEVIDRLAGLRSETERNALAQELFSRGWTSMVPVIQQGAAALREAADASQLTLSKEDLARTDAYRKAMADFADQIERVKIQIGRGLVVPITLVLRQITETLESPHGGTAAQAARLFGEWGLTTEGGGAADLSGTVRPAGSRHIAPSAGPPDRETEGERKAREAREKLLAESREKEIRGWVQYVEELQRLWELELRTENALGEEQVKARQATAKQVLDAYLAQVAEEERIVIEAWDWFNDFQRRAGEQEVKTREEIAKTVLESYIAQVQEEERIMREAWAAVDRYNETMADRQARMRADIEGMFGPVSRALQGTLQGILEGTQTVEEGFRRMGQNIAASLVENLINQGLKRVASALAEFAANMGSAGGGSSQWLSALLQIIGSAMSGARASGGSVWPGQSYLVGERGPELFQPAAAGAIIPTHQLVGRQTTIYIDARKAERGVSTEIMRAIQTGMHQAVSISLARSNDERRRGGMRGFDR